jgi:hypothetical protein
VSVEALLGLPVALRLQAALPVRERVSLAAEGTVGAWVVVPFAGAGGRVLWSAVRGPQDALQVNPGVEADFTGRLGTLEYPRSLVTPTVQLEWLHNIGRDLGCEVGMEVGGGVPLDHRATPRFVPRLSFCLGLRF